MPTKLQIIEALHATSTTDIRRIATRELGRGIAQRWFR